MPKLFSKLAVGTVVAAPLKRFLDLAGSASCSMFGVLFEDELSDPAVPTFTPPGEFGAAEATCTCADLGVGEAELDRLAVLSPGDGSAGG
jgi:hypothetical protein